MRVVVFIDYQNAHLAALDSFHPARTAASFGHIEPRALGDLLVARRVGHRLPSELSGVRVYRGRPEPRRQPGAAANDRQTDAWDRQRDVTTIRRPLRYPRGWPNVPAQEKGIDVALAVDLVRLAAEGAYDVAIVLSGDTDLLPAIETVATLTGAHVEVAARRRQPRGCGFPTAASCGATGSTRTPTSSVEDLTNYTKSPGRRR